MTDVVEALVALLPSVDEAAVEYLAEVASSDDVERDDVKQLLQSLVEDEDVDHLLGKVMKCVGKEAEDTQHEDDGPQKLTSKQLKMMNSLSLEEDHIDEPNAKEVFVKQGEKKEDRNRIAPGSGLSEDTDAQTGAKIKKSKKKTSKGASSVSQAKKAPEEAPVLPKDLVKEGEFHTKRFERFHKTWAGKSQWKLQDHRMADAVDELDDDDYSTAWLECLRLGIPWGGRGAGGRGIQRVTGETKDVLIPNVTMARGGVQLLNNSTLKLNHGARYCLTGRNGSGKTTLLRRIARGALPGWPPWLQVQYVEQELKGSDLTPVEYVLKYDFERTRLLAEEQELLTLLEEDETADLKAQTRLSEVYERLEQISAWDAESRAEQALERVGFTKDLLEKTTEELSGGWRMRCALCGTLFMKPDVLLLDEPTNALDALGVAWLTQYLGNRDNFNGTVLVVSHDREFINTITDEMIILRKQQFTYFDGTYDEYREMVEQKRQGDASKLAVMEKKKSELRDYISEQQRAARDKKSKGGDPKKQKQIRSRKKRIEKMDQHGFGTGDGRKFKQSVHGWYGQVAAVDFDEKPLHFKFPNTSIQNGPEKVLMQFDNVEYGWTPENPLISSFSAQVVGGVRLGILGQNGVGKSTLLQLMEGSLQPLKGEVHVNVNRQGTAYYQQHMIASLPEDKSAVEMILALPRGGGTMDCQTEEAARVYLGTYGLAGAKSTRPVGTLSGGEKARVVFALESYKLPQLLILDEPSQHLDMESIEVLSSAINAYNGTVIIVSHDRRLLAETCDSLWVFDSKSKAILPASRGPDEEREEFVNKKYDEFLQRNMPKHWQQTFA
mmetsp:Transcript_3469/g.5946  ORF Transcript_3469/g.5946 Transcript_3469/m.5946 type:complete len:836 (+) Transcript_3469:262-2769(+)|eukprot:CAMPEP_0184526452 /NCGR_PEP_ID=MMETSP0198_2-20121128/10662_1 /TAXON_ID=1112570 /ORGANISM="Thraustochytrium sp., Strain LLF1b" /LENGTH=835 /DNA_ID=CAMNT_0026918025 /DNA_START=194 /DNA_END=2701 /DNA_ORIENTATION=-